MIKSQKYTVLNESIKNEMLKCEVPSASNLVNFLAQKDEKYTYFPETHKYFVNSFLPSIPGKAWERMVSGINKISNLGQRIPLQADIVVTGKCHCNCWHCFRAEYDSDDMSFEQIISCIEELHEMGTANIGITGGEPMLRNDILDIIKAIPDGMEGQLYTTGTKINDEFAEKLKETNLTRCIISLDHYKEEKVYKTRNNRQAFLDAVNASKALVKAGIYTAVTLCITEELLEKDVLKNYMEFAKSLGVSEVRIVMQIPHGNLKEKNVGRIYGQSLNFIKNMQKTYNHDESYPTLLNFSEFESARYFGCGAGSHYITINNDGMITPCVAVPLAFGSVYQGSISEVYKKMEKTFPCSNGVCYGIASGSVIKNENIDVGIPPLSLEKSMEVAKKCDIVSRQSALFKACKYS